MRRSAWTAAVLLGIAALATEARATPMVAATVTIAGGGAELVGGRRHGHHGFHRGGDFHRHFHHGKGFAGQHRVGRPLRYGDGFFRRPVGNGQFVLITPTYGRTVRYLYVVPRPLMSGGRFVRHGHW